MMIVRIQVQGACEHAFHLSSAQYKRSVIDLLKKHIMHFIRCFNFHTTLVNTHPAVSIMFTLIVIVSTLSQKTLGIDHDPKPPKDELHRETRDEQFSMSTCHFERGTIDCTAIHFFPCLST